MFKMAADFTKMVQVNTRYIRAAPYGQLTVAMLANNNRVNAAAVHIQVASENVFKTGSIKNRTRTNHPVRRIAGNLPGRIGQYVHRI